MIGENKQAAAAATAMHLEAMRAELSAGLAQFQGAQRLDAARAVDVSGRALALNGRGRLMGWSVRATTGGTIDLLDGVSEDNGLLVGTISLGLNSAWNESRIWFGPGGISLTEGLYIRRTTGVFVGVVYLGAVD